MRDAILPDHSVKLIYHQPTCHVMIVSELNVHRNKLGNSDVKQGLFSFSFLSGASVARKKYCNHWVYFSLVISMMYFFVSMLINFNSLKLSLRQLELKVLELAAVCDYWAGNGVGGLDRIHIFFLLSCKIMYLGTCQHSTQHCRYDSRTRHISPLPSKRPGYSIFWKITC